MLKLIMMKKILIEKKAIIKGKIKKEQKQKVLISEMKKNEYHSLLQFLLALSL